MMRKISGSEHRVRDLETALSVETHGVVLGTWAAAGRRSGRSKASKLTGGDLVTLPEAPATLRPRQEDP